MIRPLTLATMIAAMGAGLHLYQTKHEVAQLDRKLREIARAIEHAGERSLALHAEWAWLNEPERLRQNAQRHLQLEPMQPTQFVRVTELERRLPALVPYDGPPALFAARREPLPEAASAAAPGAIALIGPPPERAAKPTAVAALAAPATAVPQAPSVPAVPAPEATPAAGVLPPPPAAPPAVPAPAGAAALATAATAAAVLAAPPRPPVATPAVAMASPAPAAAPVPAPDPMPAATQSPAPAPRPALVATAAPPAPRPAPRPAALSPAVAALPPIAGAGPSAPVRQAVVQSAPAPARQAIAPSPAQAPAPTRQVAAAAPAAPAPAFTGSLLGGAASRPALAPPVPFGTANAASLAQGGGTFR